MRSMPAVAIRRPGDSGDVSVSHVWPPWPSGCGATGAPGLETSRAAAALDSWTVQPRSARSAHWRSSDCGSFSVPVTETVTPLRVSAARKAAIAGASAATGSSSAPWPRTIVQQQVARPVGPRQAPRWSRAEASHRSSDAAVRRSVGRRPCRRRDRPDMGGNRAWRAPLARSSRPATWIPPLPVEDVAGFRGERPAAEQSGDRPMVPARRVPAWTRGGANGRPQHSATSAATVVRSLILLAKQAEHDPACAALATRSRRRRDGSREPGGFEISAITAIAGSAVEQSTGRGASTGRRWRRWCRVRQHRGLRRHRWRGPPADRRPAVPRCPRRRQYRRSPPDNALQKPRPTPSIKAVPQSGPITRRPSPSASVLERAFLRYRDIVGEHHDVGAGTQRLHRLGHHMRARNGDDGDPGARRCAPPSPSVAW